MQDNNDKAKRKQVRNAIDFIKLLGCAVLFTGCGATLPTRVPGVSVLETGLLWEVPVMCVGALIVVALRIWMNCNKEKWQEPEERNETK